MAQILILEDEAGYQTLLTEILTEHGHQPVSAFSAPEAQTLLQDTQFDLYLIDNRMEGLTGLEFLQQRRAQGDQTPVIIMTAYAEVPVVVEAMRQSAFDFLVKPFHIEDVAPLVERGLKSDRSPSGSPAR